MVHDRITECLLLPAVHEFYRSRALADDLSTPSSSAEGAAATRSSFSPREVTWRANFAMRIYEILPNPEFRVVANILPQVTASADWRNGKTDVHSSLSLW